MYNIIYIDNFICHCPRSFSFHCSLSYPHGGGEGGWLLFCWPEWPHLPTGPCLLSPTLAPVVWVLSWIWVSALGLAIPCLHKLFPPPCPNPYPSLDPPSTVDSPASSRGTCPVLSQAPLAAGLVAWSWGLQLTWLHVPFFFFFFSFLNIFIGV